MRRRALQCVFFLFSLNVVTLYGENTTLPKYGSTEDLLHVKEQKYFDLHPITRTLDLNGDGLLDILALYSYHVIEQSRAAAVQAFLNDGHGGLVEANNFRLKSGPRKENSGTRL